MNVGRTFRNFKIYITNFLNVLLMFLIVVLLTVIIEIAILLTPILTFYIEEDNSLFFRKTTKLTNFKCHWIHTSQRVSVIQWLSSRERWNVSFARVLVQYSTTSFFPFISYFQKWERLVSWNIKIGVVLDVFQKKQKY